MPYFGKPVDRVIKQGQDTVGSDAIIDDSVLPAKLDSTASYTVGGLTVQGGTADTTLGFNITNYSTIYPSSNNLYIKTVTNGTGIVLESRTGYVTIRPTDTITNAQFRPSGTNYLGYDSTGSNAKLIWDASSARLGIGTTSPNAALDILGSSSDQLRLRTAESEEYKIGRNSSTGLLEFYATQSGYTGYTFGGVDGERMRIDSSGNVGIGYTSPYGLLHVAGDPTQRNGVYPGLVLANDTDAYSTSPEIGIHFAAEYHSDGTVTDFAHISGGKYNATSGNYSGILKFYTRTSGDANVTERMRLDFDGIKFNGDTATANALNDYEEGNWTPNLDGATVSSSGTYEAKYTKIGRVVHITFNLQNATLTGTGNSLIYGLPFAPSERSTTSSIASHNAFGSGVEQGISGIIEPGTSRIAFIYNQTSSAWAAMNKRITSGVYLQFAGTYFTNS